MPLQLTNFKQVLPQAILTKGRDYFRNGHIADLSEEDEGVWSAQVVGTDTYDVQIRRDESGTLECTCTCPYAETDYCKHIAAALYAIEETFPEYLGGKKPRTSARKKPTRADKLRSALAAASDTAVRALLIELAESDRAIYNKVMLQFDRAPDSKSYERMVKDALRAGRGEYGYIDENGAVIIAKQIGELFKRADTLITQGQADDAVLIYRTAIDMLMPVMETAGDSEGDLNACIEDAEEGLKKCIPFLSDSARRTLFEGILADVQDRSKVSSDYFWGVLEVVAAAVTTQDERIELFDVLEGIDNGRIRSQSYYGDYQRAQTAEIRLLVIERLDGETAADAFIQANQQFSWFKMEYIRRLIDRGQFERAKAAIAQSEAHSEHELGNGSFLRDFSRKIAEQTGDIPGLIEIIKKQFIDYPNETNLIQLKRLVPADQWLSVVDDLEAALSASSWKSAALPAFYVALGLWDRLLKFIQASPDEKWLDASSQKELDKRFPTEMAAWYEQGVSLIMRTATGRTEYERVADYLRRMKQLGQTVRATAIKAELKAKYPKRRALLEELDKALPG